MNYNLWAGVGGVCWCVTSKNEDGNEGIIFLLYVMSYFIFLATDFIGYL